MSIEVEFLHVPLYPTGMVGIGVTGVYTLLHAPTTGVDGVYDIAVDPLDGPAQEYGKDFGVTHMGVTGAITINLATSDIKSIVNSEVLHGVTGVLTLRVVYNY